MTLLEKFDQAILEFEEKYTGSDVDKVRILTETRATNEYVLARRLSEIDGALSLVKKSEVALKKALDNLHSAIAPSYLLMQEGLNPQRTPFIDFWAVDNKLIKRDLAVLALIEKVNGERTLSIVRLSFDKVFANEISFLTGKYHAAMTTHSINVDLHVRLQSECEPLLKNCTNPDSFINKKIEYLKKLLGA